MVFGNQVPDKTLLAAVNKKLQRTGIQAKITASVKGGYVVLSGRFNMRIKGERLCAANQVPGVRQVVDQMTVQPRRKPA